MALSLLAVQQRSTTRIRLKFDGAVGGAAFGASALPNYTAAESYDGSLTAERVWAVTGALAFACDPNAIELVLGQPLTDGAWFWIIFNASVPAASGPPFAGASSALFRTAEPLPQLAPEVPATDLNAILWGEDFVFALDDFVETPDGDLLTTTGVDNVINAQGRRQVSEGLLWDGSYGLKPSQYIDGPAVIAAEIAGSSQAQAVADDRIVAAKSVVGPFNSDLPDQVVVETTMTLFSGQTVSVSTPLGG